MKRNRIFLAITVGILLLGFMPTVQAKSTILPLEHWWKDCWWWYETNPHLGGFWDPDNDLIVRPHTTDFDGGWVYEPIWDCDYSGYVKVRELNGKDGYDVMVTVIRMCNDAPFILLDWDTFPVPVFYGLMNYISISEFKIDLDKYPFVDGDEWDLPIWWMPIFGWNTWDPRDDGMEVVSTHFIAQGEGVFLEAWNGWEIGDTANVKVNQIGLVKFVGEDGWSDHPNGHPNYYAAVNEDYLYSELWPVEYIRVY